MLITRLLAAFAIWAVLAVQSDAQQTVRVGVAATGAPYSFHDDATNTDQGFMVDVINEVAKRANLKLQFQSMAFDTLIPSLTNNRIDLIVATLGISDARKMQIAFSQKVYSDSDALLVPQSDASKYGTYDDLNGKILGLQKGVVPLTSLHTDKYAKIRIYDGGPDVMRALVAGDVQVAVVNRSIAGYLLKTGGFPTLQIVPSFKPTTFGDVAFGLRKDETSLLGMVNDALAKIKADGTLDAILVKWAVQ
jgi:polar amino acid transport system substrate-binding protein